MVVEINNGLLVSLERLLSDNEEVTYRGKTVKFEQSEKNPMVYTAQTKISDEEKKAGNSDYRFIFSVEDALGKVTVQKVIPEEVEKSDEFKDLTDSEKVTKLNSIAYQHRKQEPTDTKGAGGSRQLDSVLLESASQSSSTSSNREQQPQQQKEQQQQTPKKGEKEKGRSQFSDL